MSTELPDRLERVGIVIGCTLILALPTYVLLDALFDLEWWLLFAIACLPGLLAGQAVAYDPQVPLEYDHVWRVGVVSLVGLGVLFSLWNDPIAWGEVAFFALAFAVVLGLASYEWWAPRLRGRVG